VTDSTRAEPRPADTDSGAPRGASAHSSGPEATISASDTSAGKTYRIGDRVFSAIATASGAFVVALIAAIGLFLLIRAIPALQVDQVSFLFSRVWDTRDPGNLSSASSTWPGSRWPARWSPW
jgi:phosphate transport system permease protein